MNVWRDVRLAWRGLWRSPSFAILAVLALGLGMGASTAVFSVVNTVLLEPLPFAEPGRLVSLRESRLPQFPSFSVAPGNFVSWLDESRTFEDMAAIEGAALNLTGSGEPETLRADKVSAHLFELLGVRPVIGRYFTAADDHAGAEGVVVLSEALWRGRFGGDAALLGRALTLSGRPYTVIGVAPRALNIFAGDTVQAWIPMAMDASRAALHTSHFLRAVGRLRDGVSVDEARADLDRVALQLEAQFPESNGGWRVLVTPLHEYLVRDLSTALIILAAAVGLVLLVVCANVASLLMARGLARRREMAVRTALGAGRGRLVREQLGEALALSLAAGPLGLFAGWGLLRGMLVLAPAGLPRTTDLGLDGAAMAFAAALTCLMPVVFGLVPALHGSRADVLAGLAAGGRSVQPSLRARTRGALVIGQLALALVLLIGSALLARSLVRLLQVDPGFDVTNGLVVSLRLPTERYSDPADRVAVHRRLLDQLAVLPGVSAVGLTQSLPFVNDYVTGIEFEGQPPVGAADRPHTNFYAVSPGYFDAMGIRLIRGRGIEERDRDDAPRVVVINETFARRFYAGRDPIGQRVRISQGPDDFREIVGIVADTKQYGFGAETTAQAYESYQQHGFGAIDLVVRSAGDPSALTAAIRAEVRAIDANQPIGRVTTIEGLLEPSLALPRFSVALVGTFAGVGLLLAAISLYGLVAYTVRQRAVEIGVRMALGARRADILRMVLRQALRLATAGMAIGGIVAYAAARAMRAMLFDTSPGDPATFVAMPLVLLAVVLLASVLAARRAGRVDPAVALRGD